MKPRRIDAGEQVDQVAISPAGRIFLTTIEGKLACFDLAGVRIREPEWSPDLSRRLILRVADDGRPWVGVGESLVEIDHDGRDGRTLEVVRDDRERLGSFLITPKGFYLCLYRPGPLGPSGPTITKLGPSGMTLRLKMLPVGTIDYSGVV